MEAKKRYPKVNMRASSIDFTRTTSYMLNSNGVDFLSSQGIYQVMAMFSSQDGKKLIYISYLAGHFYSYYRAGTLFTRAHF